MTPRRPGNSYRGNNSNFQNMFFLSLVIHLVVISAIFISIPTSSRHLTFGTAYSVQLVGSEAILPSRDSSLLEEALQTSEDSTPIIIKKKVSSIYSTPMKNQETDRSHIEKAVSALSQKANQKKNAADSAVTSGGSPMSDGAISAQTNEYIGLVWSRVKQNWSLPHSLMPENNVTAVIEVRIGRGGVLERADFEKRSGNRYFDESALRAVKKSSPFPPLPNWMRENSLEIGIRFHSSELR